MPDVRRGESRDSFMSRCISELIEKEGREQDQAVAICSSIYREQRSTNRNELFKLAKIE